MFDKEKFNCLVKQISLSGFYSDLRTTDNNITTYERYVEDYKRKKEILKNTISENEKEISMEDVALKINNLPFVEKFSFNDYQIEVLTKNLKCKSLDLGPYIFNLSITNGIKWTRERGPIPVGSFNYHHIFISSPGGICYGGGDLEDQIYDYKAQGRFDLILVLTWELLRNFDLKHSSPFVSWKYFREAFKRTEKEKEEARLLKELNENVAKKLAEQSQTIENVVTPNAEN